MDYEQRKSEEAQRAEESEREREAEREAHRAEHERMYGQQLEAASQVGEGGWVAVQKHTNTATSELKQPTPSDMSRTHPLSQEAAMSMAMELERRKSEDASRAQLEAQLVAAEQGKQEALGEASEDAAIRTRMEDERRKSEEEEKV